MARGPQPKDPEVRQRRNKASTAAELPAPGSPELRKVKIPSLNGELLGLGRRVAIKAPVRRWWNEVWRSPMAPRWLKTDVEVLYICALIRQQIVVFALEGKSVASLASELRQQEARVGLDVLARRRLDWRIEGPKLPDDPEQKSAAASPPEPGQDPRHVLRAVK